jgi:hypothetical protein
MRCAFEREPQAASLRDQTAPGVGLLLLEHALVVRTGRLLFECIEASQKRPELLLELLLTNQTTASAILSTDSGDSPFFLAMGL